MAQAARLNLRMQREVKLLLTDPPLGASFPSLSESNFSSIDTNFQGPEGTVYANGVFKIKIQIPERYPFQPPLVTFVTPIYHPNIDNGGRICLDILNLPPKGSWQPSLNISTVLTSIGLLLSEPNPDDGLMHEASRDYKYNRQAFEQNARSVTEKYATIRDSEGGSHDCPTHTGRSTRRTEGEGSHASFGVAEHLSSHKGFSGSVKKLSLGSSSSSVSSGKEIKDVTIHCHTEIGPLKEAKDVASNCEKNADKLQSPLYKQSVRVSDISHGANCDSPKINLPDQFETQTPSTNPLKSFPLVTVDNHKQVIEVDEYRKDRSRSKSITCEKQALQSLKYGRRSIEFDGIMDHVNQSALSQLDATKPHETLPCSLGTSHDRINPRKDATGMNDNGSAKFRLHGESSRGKIPTLDPLGGLPQSHLEDEKENLIPVRHLLHKLTGDTSSPHSKFLRLTNDVRLDEKHEINEVADDKFERSSGEDDVIVLDSEDSGDETPARSKLLLARKRLLRKRKSRI